MGPGSHGTKCWHWLVWSMGHRPRWGTPTTELIQFNALSFARGYNVSETTVRVFSDDKDTPNRTKRATNADYEVQQIEGTTRETRPPMKKAPTTLTRVHLSPRYPSLFTSSPNWHRYYSTLLAPSKPNRLPLVCISAQ